MVCLVPCVFECSSLALYERYEKKQGLPSLLYLNCSTNSYRYICEFFTTAKVTRSFLELINELLLLGHGYAGTEKFNTLVNISKPITVNNYNIAVSKIIDVVNFVDVVYQMY